MKKRKEIIMRIIPVILVVLFAIPTIVFAENVNSTYNGEYSLDYLLRNYNVVTFGQNEHKPLELIKNRVEIKKGNVNLGIEGPVLINGDYENNDIPSDWELNYSTSNPTNSVSFIKGTTGSNVKTDDKISTNEDFIDFKKLYEQILAESYSLADKTEYHINDKHINIEKPGIYQINSTRINSTNYYYKTENFATSYNDVLSRTLTVKYLYIDNYNPTEYYIFNITKLYEYDNYVVLIKEEDGDTFEILEDYVTTKNYTGNIIFNYPDAKMIVTDSYSGKLIAPKADVVVSNTRLSNRTSGYDYLNRDIYYHDSIFANSINGYHYSYNGNVDKTTISYKPYTSSKKISTKPTEIEEVVDYDDDIYNGTYSIQEMLKNYNVVTLGQKKYDNKTYFSEKYEEYNDDYFYGDADIFHIVGNFLINGELRTYRLDLESNRKYESTVANEITHGGYSYEQTNGSAYKRWGDGDSNIGTNSNVYVKENYYNIYDRDIYDSRDFINFERLYNTITKEQKDIQKGTEVTVENGIAHIKIGSNNYINDINSIKEIIFDDFDKNSNAVTVITILNDNEVNFPLISQTSSGKHVSTKDYFGKKEPLFQYEFSNFPDDIYHGNIIWNLPNAKYIQLAKNAPFMGHLIAPNADLETSETHFSGSFIVNSLYAEGNSEAHFFPLQAINLSPDFDCKDASIQFGYFGYGETILQEIVPETPNQSEDKIENPPTSTGRVILLIVLFVLANVIIIKGRNIQKNSD